MFKNSDTLGDKNIQKKLKQIAIDKEQEEKIDESVKKVKKGKKKK